jgi:hypothetical protein
MRSLWKRVGLACGVAASLLVSFEFIMPAFALPAGYFHLRGSVHDDYLGGALRAWDAVDKDQRVSGYVRLNATTFAKNSQLWQEIFPRTGTLDVIRIRNKLTGQCLGMPQDNTGQAVLRPCSDPITLWQKIPFPGNRVVFRRSESVVGPFLDDFIDCLAKDKRWPGKLLVLPCNDGFTPEMTWEAYISG